MRDDLTRDPVDPIAMARRDLRKALPRRFWSEVTVAARDGGFGVDLDGKPVRTPAKAAMIVPTRALAEALAGEWRAQGETVEPDSMPMTRLVNSALDGVANTMEATVAEVAKYAESDLVCYRAGEPDKLVAAQAQAWNPVLAFARDDLGARFVCSEGVVYAKQPEGARAAVRDEVKAIAQGPAGSLRLAALSVMTSLTGSALIALAVARQCLSAEAAWSAANVDEDHQRGIWGADQEMLTRRAHRWRDMAAAARVFELSVKNDISESIDRNGPR